MVFHWSLSDSKSPQVSWTRLRILAVLSNDVVWTVFTRPPTSKSFRPFNNPLVIVPKAPTTIGTIVTFMFHSFFNSLARSRYLSYFLLLFSSIKGSQGNTRGVNLTKIGNFRWVNILFCSFINSIWLINLVIINLFFYYKHNEILSNIISIY